MTTAQFSVFYEQLYLDIGYEAKHLGAEYSPFAGE